MRLRFDHSFSVDNNFAFRKKLGKAGFRLEDYMVEHPGKHFCRFIPMQISKKAGCQYIEFVHVGKGGQPMGKPGLSLGALEPLEPVSKKLKVKGVNVNFAHKNYEWKTNSKDRLPGWNFVTFPKNRSKIFTWLTEYEKSARRKKRHRKLFDPKHPNQVFKVVELDCIFDAKDMSFFKKLCGGPKKDHFALEGGAPIYFSKGKTSKIRSIVLGTKDLNRLVKKFEWDELTSYKGQVAVRIKNPNKGMWDVLIVQA